MRAVDTPPPELASHVEALTTKGKPLKVSDQTIYDAIYDAVLEQRLPPGTKLLESALTELFGISRSIVRKALTRLASDHVVEQRHSQVATIAQPSIDETRQIFEARVAVEGELVRLLSGHLSKSQAKELRRRVAEEAKAHEGGHIQGRTMHGMGLHLFLADCCPNQVLGEIQRSLVLRTSIAISLYKTAGASSCFLGDDHSRLVDLIESGAGDDAAALVRRHLRALEGLLDLDQKDAVIDLATALRFGTR